MEKKKKKYRLDREERDILDAIENGEWKSVQPEKPELERYVIIARNTLKKNERMNIRISRADLDRLKSKAAEEGIPYQTLVASILHKYMSGGLPQS